MTQEYRVTVDADGHLHTDEGLRTMVLLSLFTDRRAADADPVPDSSDPRGWWGDSYPEVEGDEFGSKWWMLQGMKADSTALEFAKAEGAAALQWMIDDGIVDSVTIECQLQGQIMASRVGLQRPADPSVLWIPLWDVALAGA